jgi:NADH:ubiquinone oxidoreductase subunit 2 (subunit N)
MALISLIIGSIGMLVQRLIISFLTYSAVFNVGFLLLAIYAKNSYDILYYIIIYSITTINVFSILLLCRAKLLTELLGLFIVNPYLTILFALNLFSLAGIPP